MSDLLKIESTHGGRVARVWLDRPEVHNALSRALADALTETMRGFGPRSPVRVVVLAGRGPSFCAGADLNEMKASAPATIDQNLAEATHLSHMFAAVADCPRPVIARVHGNVFGGGVGLCAAADIAVGASDAVFAISEVRLGIVPAIISPYLLRRMGDRFARPLILTGHRFDGRRAAEVGLLQRAVEPAALDATVDHVVGELLQGSPQAQAKVKELLRLNAENHFGEVVRLMPNLLAEARSTAEAREGFQAFFEKRKPAWAAEADEKAGGGGAAPGQP
jgi:methylglutaconyl-CoA hydratase